MTPSVGGKERVRVGGSMLAAAGVTGAIAGFVPGLAWAAAGLGRLPVTIAVPFVVADALLVWRGAPAPVSLRSQVPTAWTSVFPIRTAAALYGARLGVGALTILYAWTWWAATLLAVSISPLASTMVGATFGVVRVGAILAASSIVASDAPRRMAKLASAETRAAVVLGALAVAALVGAAT